MNLCKVILHWRYPPSLTRCTSVLRFIQVTKPIISSWIIHFQVEQTNNIVAHAVFIFILNISVEQIKFQYNGGSISKETWPSSSQWTFMTVDNVKSFIQALTYMSSDIHRIRKSICTPIHVFKKIYLVFSIKNWTLQHCLWKNSVVFTSFYDIYIIKWWCHSRDSWVLQMSLTPKPHVTMN